MNKKRLLVFASGSKSGGGSGFEKLFEASRDGRLSADIIAVVSNHEHGGVRERADRLGVRFIHSPKPRTADDYKKIVADTKPDFIALSGWLGIVEGLDPRITFNIHPAYLPSPYGGSGFYGHHVHEAVMDSYKKGETSYAGVSMHFVTSVIDDPNVVFFRRKVPILPDDMPETLAKRVNELEHKFQAEITNRVVEGEISWDGRDPSTLTGKDVE